MHLLANPAVNLHCTYCRGKNRASEWPERGDSVPFTYRLQRGAYSVTVSCPRCGREWYVVWDVDPGRMLPVEETGAGADLPQAPTTAKQDHTIAAQVQTVSEQAPAPAHQQVQPSASVPPEPVRPVDEASIQPEPTPQVDKATVQPEPAPLADEATVRKWVEEGRQHLRSRNIDAAITLLRQAIASDPGNYQAQEYVGMAYGFKGDLGRAMRHMEKAIAIDPSVPQAHYNLGLLYQSAHRPAEALREYEEAVALEPGYQQARTALEQLVQFRAQRRSEGKIEAQRIELKGHEGAVTTLCFLSNSELATAGTDKSVILWSLPGGNTRLPPMQGHKYSVQCLCASPDGKIVASGSSDETVMLWDRSSGTALRSLKHEGPVRNLAFTPDGDHLVTAGNDKVCAWQTASGAHVASADTGTEAIYGFALSADGSLVAVGGDSGKVLGFTVPRMHHAFNLSPKTHEDTRRERTHTDSVNVVAFTKDSRFLMTCSDDGSIRIWAVPIGHLLHILHHKERGTRRDIVNSIALDPLGRLFVSAGGFLMDHTVRLWSLPECGSIATLEGHGLRIECLAISDDGSLLATGGYDNTIQVWSLPDGKKVLELEGRAGRNVNVHGPGFTCMAFSPALAFLAAGNKDGSVEVWALDA